jgi:hypothetical protein
MADSLSIDSVQEFAQSSHAPWVGARLEVKRGASAGGGGRRAVA